MKPSTHAPAAMRARLRDAAALRHRGDVAMAEAAEADLLRVIEAHQKAAGPPRPGQTLRGRCIVDLLDTGELVLLEMLTRFAAKGALHDNKSALASDLFREADWLELEISVRAHLALVARKAREALH